jgi:hypothetical protein
MCESLRFRPPWYVNEGDESFAVHDAAGQTLAHVYFDDEPRLGLVKERLTREEARCIAVDIVKLPKLLNRPQY